MKRVKAALTMTYTTERRASARSASRLSLSRGVVCPMRARSSVILLVMARPKDTSQRRRMGSAPMCRTMQMTMTRPDGVGFCLWVEWVVERERLNQ